MKHSPPIVGATDSGRLQAKGGRSPEIMGGSRASGVVSPSIRAALGARLREQLSELEPTVYSEVCPLSTQEECQDPGYLAGLRVAVAESLEWGIAGIERGGDPWSHPLPPATTAQARRAARHGVDLGTVLGHYAAGDRKLAELVWAENGRFPAAALRQLVAEQGMRVRRLMDASSREYTSEREEMRRSPTARRSEWIRRLLTGDGAVDPVEIDYVFDTWHLGLIARGVGGKTTIRALASALDRTALISEQGDAVTWGWLGGRRPLSVAEVERTVRQESPEYVELALGEPREGLDGWRLTHHEAEAALAVMLHRPQALMRGSEVALLAAMLTSPPLAESVLETFLAPWAGRHHGSVLRATLRTYLATGLNAESTAKLLRIDPSTVRRHLRAIEEALGRPIRGCHAELKVALELWELWFGLGEAGL